MLIGMAVSDPKRRDAIQGTLGFEYSVMIKAYEENRNKPATDKGWEPSHEAFEKIRAEVDELLKNRKPFHWFLEFPEVFVDKGDKAGFAAIMSNPPFQGAKMIVGALRADYREFIVEYLARGKRGGADLCAYFFLRADQLVSQRGHYGLLATNSISQGHTREVGLEQIVSMGGTIIRAVSSRRWPGTASLEVAHIWLSRGEWHGPYLLDDKFVEGITSFPNTSKNSAWKAL